VKSIAVGAAVVGLVFGLLFVIGPFYFGTPTDSWVSFVMPVVLAVAIMRTHYLNLRGLRDSSVGPPRWRLLTYNVLLLSFLTLGLIMMYERDTRFRQMPAALTVYLALGVASFGVSALYLCLPIARGAAATAQ
jgi:hypothetical protein